MADTVEPGGTGRETAREAAHVAQEHASELWSDAKQAARSKLNQEKDAAAQGLGDVAGALRDAARRGDAERDGFARLTRSAADGLDRLSGTLRERDVSAMLRDVESFARRQPVAFFGLALAAGFLVARSLKDSREQPWT